MSTWYDYPSMFRHMVVAIYNKLPGGGPDAVEKAMLISLDKMGQWGYLYHRGGNEVLEGVKLTGKGWVRNQKHLAEGLGGQGKDLEFSRLFEMIRPRLHILDGPGGTKEPKAPTQAPKDPEERSDEERGDIGLDDRRRALYPPPK